MPGPLVLFRGVKMEAERIDGRALAKQLDQKTAARIATLAAQGTIPGIAVILIGTDPASMIYTKNKERRATKLGMKSVLKTFPETVSQETVLNCIADLNGDPTIHAILVQAPLPPQIDRGRVDMAIAPEKDVDGFHPLNLGRLYGNQPGHYPVACTPRGIMTMLDHYQVPLVGVDAVVMGRSILVGKPLSALLTNAGATVTMVTSKTVDSAYYLRHADLAVVAIGQPEFVRAPMVKPGAVVIDVGINRRADGHLVGDVDFAGVAKVARLITPVPGGVGPMTIATLMAQTVDLAEWSVVRNG